jgi:hypothetical protein
MKKFGWQFLALLFTIQPVVFFAQTVERTKPGFTLSIKEVDPSTLSDGYPADYHKLLVTYINISDAAQKDWWDQLDSLDMLNMIVLRDGAPADELPAMSKLRKFREAVGSGRRLSTHDIHGPAKVLKPGESVTFSLEISGYFDMSKPGTYTITVNRETYPWEPAKSVTVWSNTIEIVVPQPGAQTPQ